MLDWNRIDTVLLDMDGTVLDLHYDNHVWNVLVPQRYGAARALTPEAAHHALFGQFRSGPTPLAFYCLDHWQRTTGLDIDALLDEYADRIRWLPGAREFLAHCHGRTLQVVMVTNAHRRSIEVKHRVTGITDHFERIISSHDYGVPKEDPVFWDRLAADLRCDPDRTLFVDDTARVLDAARTHGIAHIRAIGRPDSHRAARSVADHATVDDLGALLPRGMRS